MQDIGKIRSPIEDPIDFNPVDVVSEDNKRIRVELYTPLPPGSEPTKIRSLRTGELTYISNGNGQLLRAHPKIKGKSNVKKYKRLRHEGL